MWTELDGNSSCWKRSLPVLSYSDVWAITVKLCREMRAVPIPLPNSGFKRYAVKNGTLHDCATTDDTEKGGVPIKDEDGWIQYAVAADVVQQAVLRWFVAKN